MDHWKNDILHDVRLARAALTQKEHVVHMSLVGRLLRDFLLVDNVEHLGKAHHENFLVLVQAPVGRQCLNHSFH